MLFWPSEENFWPLSASITSEVKTIMLTNTKKVLSAPFHFGAFYLVILHLSDRNFIREADRSQITDHNNKPPSPIMVISDILKYKAL